MLHKLKLTHLEQYEGRWALRFSAIGQTKEAQGLWDGFKELLKSKGTDRARWKPHYTFDDGKQGAWLVTQDILDYYGDVFSNLPQMMARALTQDISIDDFLNFDREQEQKLHKKQVYIPLHVTKALRILGFPGSELPSKAELGKAYLKLAKRFHPDVVGGDGQAMKDINHARDTVKEWAETEKTVAKGWPWSVA